MGGWGARFLLHNLPGLEQLAQLVELLRPRPRSEEARQHGEEFAEARVHVVPVFPKVVSDVEAVLSTPRNAEVLTQLLHHLALLLPDVREVVDVHDLCTERADVDRAAPTTASGSSGGRRSSGVDSGDDCGNAAIVNPRPDFDAN